MVGHGFRSSGLFFLANVAYKRVGSRRLNLIKGLQLLYPRLAFWGFILVVTNIAAPPSINLLGEIHCIVALWQ